MPIYVVRWPGLSVSLIKARSEKDLLDKIDEVESPSECIWSVYDGPLWIDLRLPVELSIEPKHPGGLRSDEVIVKDLGDAQYGILQPERADSSDTVPEMEHAIIERCFPNVAEALDNIDDEVEPADLDALRSAIIADEVDHDRATRHRSVTFGSDGSLRPTTTWYFRLGKNGRFQELKPEMASAFLLGEAPQPPDRDQYVRLASVEITLDGKRPVSARTLVTLKLRVDRAGVIDPTHRADAFEGSSDDASSRELNSTMQRFAERRNEAVRWTPSNDEAKALADAVTAKAGRPLRRDEDDDNNEDA